MAAGDAYEIVHSSEYAAEAEERYLAIRLVDQLASVSHPHSDVKRQTDQVPGPIDEVIET